MVDATICSDTNDPQAFSDWLVDMDHFVDWCKMSDELRVRFAKMKLIRVAYIYWIFVERQLQRNI